MRTNALMTEAVHRYDALAGCELAHAGLYAHCRYTCIPAMGPFICTQPPEDFPGQDRAMDKTDLRAIHPLVPVRRQQEGH